MIVAFSTANFYRMPFEAALDIIKSAGYEYIELDGAWSGGDNWETARHIKDMKPADVLAAVRRAGLSVAAFHDMGGAVGLPYPTVVSAGTEDFLRLGDIPAVIFHTPHRKNAPAGWWEAYSTENARVLKGFSAFLSVSVENMVRMEGYTVPLLDPEQMRDYCLENSLGATLDTTHFASTGVDPAQAAKILGECAFSVHLSDWKNGKSHLFPGEGDIDFGSFFAPLDKEKLYCVSVECNMPDEPDKALETARRARLAACKMAGA